MHLCCSRRKILRGKIYDHVGIGNGAIEFGDGIANIQAFERVRFVLKPQAKLVIIKIKIIDLIVVAGRKLSSEVRPDKAGSADQGNDNHMNATCYISARKVCHS